MKASESNQRATRKGAEKEHFFSGPKRPQRHYMKRCHSLRVLPTKKNLLPFTSEIAWCQQPPSLDITFGGRSRLDACSGLQTSLSSDAWISHNSSKPPTSPDQCNSRSQVSNRGKQKPTCEWQDGLPCEIGSDPRPLPQELPPAPAGPNNSPGSLRRDERLKSLTFRWNGTA